MVTVFFSSPEKLRSIALNFLYKTGAWLGVQLLR